MSSKEIQAVSVVIGLVVPGAVAPDCRDEIISGQYTAAFREAFRTREQQKNRSEASIKEAEDKSNLIGLATRIFQQRRRL